ncbi:MAG: hypothetical protein ACI9T7_001343 [Oleiphilaceae bacterium]|jgi:uncharacterized protein (TIGR02270 family)
MISGAQKNMSEIQSFIPEVINAHFDEAAYLYSEFQTERNKTEPDVDYLQNVMARINANLDGLAINASAAEVFCEEAITSGDAGEVFVASFLAFKDGDLEKIKPVADASQAEPELLEALAYALTWHPWSLSSFWATKFIGAKQITMASVGLFCFNSNKKSPPLSLNDLLARSLVDKNLSVIPLLLDIAIKNKDLSVLPALQQYCSEEQDTTLFQVLKARLKLGDASAVIELKLFVVTENTNREEVLNLVFPQLDKTEAKQWISELNSIPGSERFILLAVGVIQEKPLLPWVIKQMEKTELARVAGKVFSQLTGINLKERNWLLNEEAMDQKWLEIEGDEELEWPDVAKIQQAMQSIRG